MPQVSGFATRRAQARERATIETTNSPPAACEERGPDTGASQPVEGLRWQACDGPNGAHFCGETPQSAFPARATAGRRQKTQVSPRDSANSATHFHPQRDESAETRDESAFFLGGGIGSGPKRSLCHCQRLVPSPGFQEPGFGLPSSRGQASTRVGPKNRLIVGEPGLRRRIDGTYRRLSRPFRAPQFFGAVQPRETAQDRRRPGRESADPPRNPPSYVLKQAEHPFQSTPSNSGNPGRPATLAVTCREIPGTVPGSLGGLL
jgi:hypothetical protein